MTPLLNYTRPDGGFGSLPVYAADNTIAAAEAGIDAAIRRVVAEGGTRVVLRVLTVVGTTAVVRGVG